MNKNFTKTAPSIICLGETGQFFRRFSWNSHFFAAFTKSTYLNTSLAVTFKIEKGDEIK